LYLGFSETAPAPRSQAVGRQFKLARKFNTMRRVYREALPVLSSKQKWESVLLESSDA